MGHEEEKKADETGASKKEKPKPKAERPAWIKAGDGTATKPEVDLKTIRDRVPAAGVQIDGPSNDPLAKFALTLGGATEFEGFHDLTDERKMEVYTRAQLSQPLIINPKSEDMITSVADVMSFEVQFKPAEKALPGASVPNDGARFVSFASYSEVVTKLINAGAVEAGAYFGGLGVSAAARGSREKEQSTSSTTRQTYFVSQYVIPRVALRLLPEDLKPSADFVGAVRRVAGGALTPESYDGLIGVLNQYGYFVALKVLVGGMLRTTQKDTTVSEQDVTTKRAAFTAKLSADVVVRGLPVQAGGDVSAAQLASEGKGTTVHAIDTTIVATGGNESLASLTPSAWIGSVGKHTTWKPISYGQLVPIIYFLPDGLRAKALQIIARYSYTQRGENDLINMDRYHLDTMMMMRDA